jgi:hypothetical protein
VPQKYREKKKESSSSQIRKIKGEVAFCFLGFCFVFAVLGLKNTGPSP